MRMLLNDLTRTKRNACGDNADLYTIPYYIKCHASDLEATEKVL